MSPPNVKGWPSGEAWINSATLLARKQWTERVFRGADTMAAGEEAGMTASEAPGAPDNMRRTLERGMTGYGFEAERWSRTVQGATRREARMQSLVLAMAPSQFVADGLDEPARVRAWVADPAYQLR